VRSRSTGSCAQGLRGSIPRCPAGPARLGGEYSIKKLEPLYGLEREEGLRDAGSSIVAFESWLAEAETGTGGAAARSPQTDATLRSIEAYNRDDCVSNWRLRDWLEERRPELAAEMGEPLPRPGPAEPEAAEKLSDHLATSPTWRIACARASRMRKRIARASSTRAGCWLSC